MRLGFLNLRFRICFGFRVSDFGFVARICFELEISSFGFPPGEFRICFFVTFACNPARTAADGQAA